MAQLIWSPGAIRDLRNICDYLARDSDRYARSFARQVVTLIEAIPEQPRLGGIVPEYERDDIRERLFHNYRIIYRLRGEVIEVVRISHGARLLPPTLAN
jgi:plasmid stabilization system protein ParE